MKTKDDILHTIDRHRAELARRHVRSLALFGSSARDEAGPDSDVDLLVEFDPDAHTDLFDLMDVEEYLSSLLGRRVDLVPRSSLKAHVREAALRDAIRAL